LAGRGKDLINRDRRELEFDKRMSRLKFFADQVTPSFIAGYYEATFAQAKEVA